ncbi:MAG TPA: TauD/TfdA family dioxygenase [Candidatus Limnocylindrales bacterium]|nr:TauD/TfdA family dioxygenase [Candidatus Limnocylindrales bacterium]
MSVSTVHLDHTAVCDAVTVADALADALADVATALASEGYIGDSVLSCPTPPIRDDLHASLGQVVRPPDPSVGYRVIPGLLRGFTDPGPTPLHWREADRHRTAGLDIAVTLVASVLGDVFGWTGQQDARLVHNIVPSPGCEAMQIGASSTVPLAWHTEDAFHPDRAAYLLLACVRNLDGVGSSLSTVNQAELSEAVVTELIAPNVVVLPDDSYHDPTASAQQSIGMSTLWRDGDLLGLRYDPSYSRMLTTDRLFLDAYDELGKALEASSFVVPLQPGDLLIIDNDVTAHSRVGFRARYDGTDRWLKRVLVRAPRTRPAAERLEHGFHQAQVGGVTVRR